MLALPALLSAAGVKVAVRVAPPPPLRMPSVPPVVTMSAALKPIGTSLKLKVMVAVSPDFSANLSLRMVSVGARVSSVKLTMPAVLVLPAASMALALTVMLPSCNWLAPEPMSLLSSVTASAELLPISLLMTEWLALSLKVTATLLPDSARTTTTPVVAVASAAVAP